MDLRSAATIGTLVIAIIGGPLAFWTKHNFRKRRLTRIIVAVTILSTIAFMILMLN